MIPDSVHLLTRSSQMTLYKDLKGISMIGYVTKPELGAAMVTRDGAELPITAQGWNAFTK